MQEATRNMNMDTSTEHIFLVFIILILVVGIGYWINTSKERFVDNDVDETDYEKASTTIPQTTISSVSSDAPQVTNSIALSDSIRNQLSNISDSTTQENLSKELSNLQTLLQRYASLDIPIVMNDSGKICSMWSEYSNGRFRQQQNQCMALDDNTLLTNTPVLGNTNILKCLDTSGTPTSCNNIMTDGYISSKSSIPYQPMLDSATSIVVNSLSGINLQVNDMNKNATMIITSIADRGSIQLQQDELIRNNNENMAYKNKLMEENTEKLGKKQNETNINQNDFSSFINKITNADAKGQIYFKIIIGLIIIIMIVGIFNFLFSNILS